MFINMNSCVPLNVYGLCVIPTYISTIYSKYKIVGDTKYETVGFGREETRVFWGNDNFTLKLVVRPHRSIVLTACNFHRL